MMTGKVYCRSFTWTVCVCVALLTSKACGDAAILNISYISESQNAGSRQYVSYCAAFNPELSSLPAATTRTPEWKKLEWDGDKDLCDDYGRESRLTAGAVLAVSRRNCSAYDQGMQAEKMQASGLIIASHKMFFPGQPNITWKQPSTFPILILKMTDMARIEELPFRESWLISMQALVDTYVVDGSGIILILMAVIVIAVGSYRSGQHQYSTIRNAHSAFVNALEGGNVASPSNKPVVGGAQGASVHFGPGAAIVFAIFMTGLLVLMYFFYDYLVYLFIALFAIGATSGMFECFRPMLQWTKAGLCRIPLGTGFIGNCCGGYLDIRAVFLLLMSAGLSVFWVISRNQPYGWILLDILGSFLLISVLIGILLPSLKACTIFLCLLFIYDVFFVFITPFFTKDGQSVMIQVATGGYDPTRDSGGGQREVIPAAFKIPHIPTGALCENLFEDASYSLLGFGDVMVPGFLISFLRGFELVWGIRPVYSVSACIAYFVSLIATTAALIFMRTGQPALLYIVPILLLTIYFIAWRRREIALLWRGNLAQLYVERQRSYGSEILSDKENAPPASLPIAIVPSNTTNGGAEVF